MSISPYPSYRDSGVEWLGLIPEHWRVLRLKHACKVFPSNVDKKSVDGETPVRLCNYTDVYYNDRIGPDLDFMEATATADQIERFTLRSRDVIVTKDSETADDIAVSAFVPADLPGVLCGYHLSIVRAAPPHSGAFVKRLFDSMYTAACVAVRANGLTRVALSQYDLDNLEFSFPRPEEQVAIAAFLERETTTIDELVEEQQRLIVLLKEQLQSAISFAVTKGLSLGAPMRDAGIAWVDEVPSHWRVLPLKRVMRAVDYGISDALQRDGEVAVIRMGNIVDGRVRQDDMKFTNQIDPSLLLASGDLLYSRTNSLDQIAKVGLFLPDSETPMTFASYLVRLRPHAIATPEYLTYLLNTAEILRLARASAFVAIGQCNLNPSRYLEMSVPLPPISEQLEIVAELDGLSQRLKGLAAAAERSIALLLERRSALISAAVTGQIDVRALAPAEAP